MPTQADEPRETRSKHDVKKFERAEARLFEVVKRTTEVNGYGDLEMQYATREFVRGLIRGEISLERLIERSYKHKNGFNKIVLFDQAGHKLRFHIYKANEGDENVHDHRWACMHSLVLDGSLPADYLAVVDESHPHAEVYIDHKYSKSGKGYRVDVLGEAHIVVAEHKKHPAGSVYKMTSRELHRIVATEAPAATLVFTEPVPTERKWCHLYATKPIAESTQGEVVEQRLSVSEMRDALVRLERLLSKQIRAKAAACKKDARSRGWA
jgi:hypothetical protein